MLKREGQGTALEMRNGNKLACWLPYGGWAELLAAIWGCRAEEERHYQFLRSRFCGAEPALSLHRDPSKRLEEKKNQSAAAAQILHRRPGQICVILTFMKPLSFIWQ